ncbi:MAG: hypothetical protein A3G93_13305 [Nitrospinae bacterium RIFCSPLOWO2_12_FULL_45_22]|nr:MAG: hypothetical protein A3G93_13305 [Nitrospinae bacterium RIFCSPLOWO2_12_FULL_45_22]
MLNIFSVILITGIGPFLSFSYITHGAQPISDKILVDNFEKPGKHNSLGHDFGAFSDQKNLGHCYLFFSQDKQKESLNESKYSLYIQWDTAKEGSYGGYWSDLRHLNLESFNYLSFYVKGVKGGEKFKVGLRGKVDATYETKILINEALKEGVTVEWQRATIPLKWFKAIQNWGDVNMLSINFEYTFGSGSGAILIDDIVFEK